MGIFVLNRLSHVSHLSDVGLTDFARAHRCHAGQIPRHSCGCRRITNGGTSKRTRLTVARKRQSRLCSCRSGSGAPLVGLLITLVCSCRKPNITQPGEVNNAITLDMNSVNWKTPRAPTQLKTSSDSQVSAKSPPTNRSKPGIPTDGTQSTTANLGNLRRTSNNERLRKAAAANNNSNDHTV